MLVDIALVVIFLLAIVNGYKKGFVKSFYRFAGLIIFIGFFVWLYQPVSTAFEGGIVGAVAVAVVSWLLSHLTESLVCKIAKFPLVKEMDGLLGAALGLVIGVILVIVFAVVFNSFEQLQPYTTDSRLIAFVYSIL